MFVLLVPGPLPQLKFGDATCDKKLEKPFSVAPIILYITWFLKGFFRAISIRIDEIIFGTVIINKSQLYLVI